MTPREKTEEELTITQKFLRRIKYDGLSTKKNILEKSHFARNYNIYFYALINFSMAIIITFSSIGMFSIALLTTLHFTFNALTVKYYMKYKFLASKTEFVFRILQGAFMQIFMTTLLAMSVR